jgi:hypothetical protein
MADPKSRRVGHSARGAYILEAAMVVFGVAVFILGIADISRIFHARGAVRMGVTDGLRCLYPTDPNCQSTQPPVFVPPAPRFNAWVWGNTTGYESPRNNYRLVAQSYEEPFHEVPLLRSWLSQVEVEQPKVYRDYDLVFPVSAYSPYLLKTRDLPVLDGRSPRNPQFRRRDPVTGGSAGGSLSPNLTFPGNQLGGLRGENDSLTINIDVSSALPNSAWILSEIERLERGEGIAVPCYQGATVSENGVQMISWPQNNPPEVCSRRSQTLFQSRSLQVPIMIYITGSAGPMDTGTEAKVELSYKRDPSSRSSQDLGGVSFKPREQNVNLIPRGAFGRPDRVGNRYNGDGTSDYEWGCKNSNPKHEYSECWDYPTVWVDLGRTAQLTLTLKYKLDGNGNKIGDPGRIGWDPESVQVFFPTFEYRNQTRSCSSKTPDQCPNSLAPFRAKYYETSIQGITAEQRPGSGTSCYDSTSGFESTSAGVAYYQAQFTSGLSAMSPTQFKVSSREAKAGCVHPKNWYSCTKQTTEHLQGCNPTYTRPEKEQRCQISDYMPSIDKIVTDTVANEPTDRTDRRAKCTGNVYPSCAVAPTVTTQRQFLGWGPQSCAAAIPLQPTEGNFGPHFQYHSSAGCPDVTASVTEEFKRQHGIPTGAPLSSLIVTPAEPLRSAQPPEDPCRVVRESSSTSNETLCAENAPNWAIEKCCRENDNRCRVAAAPPRPGSPGSGGFGAINLQPALARAEQAVSVAYPPTRTGGDCNGSAANCLDVNAEVVNNDTEAVMRASMDVPLVLFSWLGQGATATVQYEERRALERGLIGVER